MNQEKVIIVLGAKYEQIPLMALARENGYEVAAVDNSENPKGRNFCKYFYNFSYRDEEKILALAEIHNISGIGTIGTNDAICYASRINKRLNLDGLYDSPEIISRATYKNIWRPFLEMNTGSVPEGKLCGDFAGIEASVQKLRLPVILKPSDSSGGKGISVVENENDLKEAYFEALKYSTNGLIIVEKYIGHNSYAVESFVIDKEVHLLAIAERKLPDAPICVGLGTTLPDVLPDMARGKIAGLNKTVIEALELTYGPVHIDMVLDNDANPFVVDIGPRLIAGPNALHIKKALGFDMNQAVFNQIIGKKEGNIQIQFNGKYFAHRYITTQESGKIKSIKFDHEFYKGNILELDWHVKPGDLIQPLKNAQNRYGYVTAFDDNFENLKQNIDKFVDQITIETE